MENHLGDLWSIFDVINPGLLGTAKQFGRYAKGLPTGRITRMGRCARWCALHLRRMKTDRSVIADLPDKTEVKAICQLSRRQVALYTQAVEEADSTLRAADALPARAWCWRC